MATTLEYRTTAQFQKPRGTGRKGISFIMYLEFHTKTICNSEQNIQMSSFTYIIYCFKA